MNRKPKQGTGLYEYLEATGVFANGTGEEIENEKKRYWKQYRKDWKKNKRQQCKKYVLYCSFKEARLIGRKADELSITAAKYIKESALAESNVLGQVLTGQVREKIVSQCSIIESILIEYDLPEELLDRVSDEMLQLEREVMQIIKPKTVKPSL